GSGNTQFDVTFNAVTAAGTYSFNVGPDIRDLANNPMDQNNNGTNGEAGDFYTAPFTVPHITGPRVTSPPAHGTDSVSSVRLTFSEAINPSTFTVADITNASVGLTPIPVTADRGSGNTQFDVTFNAVTAPGSYGFDVGPDIRDVAGNPMDQNNNGTNGEPGDIYSASFTVVDTAGPLVIAAAANGTTSVSSVRLTFSEALHARSFDASDITTAPAGLTHIAVTPVIGSGNTQFDVTFNAVSTPGNYGFTVGPNVHDLANNPMNQNGNGTNGEPGDVYNAGFTVVPNVQTFANNTSTAIRDNGTTTSTITINQAPTSADLNVRINIRHTRDSDLNITLPSPGGASVLLVNRRGGSGNNFNNTAFDDEDPTSIVAGIAPFAGTYRPET